VMLLRPCLVPIPSALLVPLTLSSLPWTLGASAGHLVSITALPPPGLPIMNFHTLALFHTALAATLLTLAALPARAADEEPKGPAISTLKATKACFSNIVEVSGTILARDEAQAQVRPDRQGVKVSEVLADAGDVVNAGQVLARVVLPEGGVQNITAPNAGLVIGSTAVVGTVASGRGEAL